MTLTLTFVLGEILTGLHLQTWLPGLTSTYINYGCLFMTITLSCLVSSLHPLVFLSHRSQ